VTNERLFEGKFPCKKIKSLGQSFLLHRQLKMNKNIVIFFIIFVVLINATISDGQTQTKLQKAFDDLQIEFVKLGLIVNDLLKELTGMDLTVSSCNVLNVRV
jgi:hypothetical protein